MTQTLNNGMEVPVPSTPYNPPADMAKMGKTADVVRRVPTQAAQNALTDLRPGTVMCRTDFPGQPLFTWDGAGWIAVAPELEFGQGNDRGRIKAREVLATTTEFSTGRVVFATPFPNACTAVTLTHSTNGLTTVSFRIIDRKPNYVEFVAYGPGSAGLPNTGLYVNYIAAGY